MAVNLVTKVENFWIETRPFTADDHDVQDGCVTPGIHRVLRFDFLSHNAGSSDLVIGNPADRPDLFVWSSGHGHYHLRDFNEFLLFDAHGSLATTGYKQAFCAIDIQRISPTASPTARFGDCNANQGISAGWADVYGSTLACQFIVIDTLLSGDYTLQSTTNAQHVAAESCFGDNIMWTGLRILGNNVTVIDPPWIPEDQIVFDRSQVGVVQVGGRWKVVEGGAHWMLDTGTSRAEADRAVELINHYELGQLCFVGRPRCDDVSPMMYWLTDDGSPPGGGLAGEDEVPFDPQNVSVVEIGGRWKVADGTHWLLDFGPGEGNAIAARHVIRKYGFDRICFVGRPYPSMTYFKTSGGETGPASLVDPRAIDATLDSPTWWAEHADLVRQVESLLKFADLGGRTVLNPVEREGVEVFLQASDRTALSQLAIGERHGLAGLEMDGSAEIRFKVPAEVVEVEFSHEGKPLTLIGYAAGTEVARKTSSDWPRQVEQLRMAGGDVDRVVLEGTGLLTRIRYRPAREEHQSAG